jgi:hypothetical protein
MWSVFRQGAVFRASTCSSGKVPYSAAARAVFSSCTCRIQQLHVPYSAAARAVLMCPVYSSRPPLLSSPPLKLPVSRGRRDLHGGDEVVDPVGESSKKAVRKQ